MAAARRRALVTLCVTEPISWGTLYYAYPVTLQDMHRDTGWSTGVAMIAFSASLVTSMLCAIPVGRLLDRHGPRSVMTAGSILAVYSLTMVAIAPTATWLVAAWIVVGLAQSMVLYNPAFAALNRWYGHRRASAITTLTLTAGTASVIFCPSVAALVTHLGWRLTDLTLAAALAVVTVPLHARYLDAPWPPAAPPSGRRGNDIHSVVRSRPFILLAATLGLTTLGFNAAVSNLIPMLTSRGVAAYTAANAMALCGAAQLAGRIGYPLLVRQAGGRARLAIVSAAGAVSVSLIALLSGGTLASTMVVSTLVGAANGTFTLVQATAIGDRWGTARVATLHAIATTPASAALALAPAAGTLLADVLGTYPRAYLVLAVAPLAGAVLAMGTLPTSAGLAGAPRKRQIE